MSIGYCEWCEAIVEGNTKREVIHGEWTDVCAGCGELVTELSEDPPEDWRY